MNPSAQFPIARAVVALAIIVLGLSRAEAAGDDFKSLQEALTLINQEQQSIFQQFQMVQQLRQLNAESVLPPIGGIPIVDQQRYAS